MVGLNSTTQGFLEVNIDGRWGAVCGGYGAQYAQVACRQLGMGADLVAAQASSGSFGGMNGSGTNGSRPFVMSALSCLGSELQLEDCSFFTGVRMGSSCMYSDAGMCMCLCVMQPLSLSLALIYCTA